MSNLLATLLLVSLTHSRAAADDYDEFETITDPRRSAETLEAARRRWQDAKTKLDAIPPGSPKDYRHCYWRAVLIFRLKGPEAAENERHDCTSSLVNGTRHDGKPGKPEVRIRSINSLNTLVEHYYKEELARLKVVLTRTTVEISSAKQVAAAGKASVTVIKNRIAGLAKSGQMTQQDAKALLDQLDSVNKSFDSPRLKIDPKDLDLDKLDWNKLNQDQLNKLSDEVKNRLREKLKPRTDER